MTGLETSYWKLSGAENWVVWKFQIEVILEEKGLHDLITGESVKPEVAAEKEKVDEK